MICAIIGNADTGKSNAVYYFIEELSKNYNFNLVTYGLRSPIPYGRKIYSVEELEQVRDSIIFLDEFFTLFDLDDRKRKHLIENTLRLIFHNNNILVLVGTPENFKKFISAKITKTFYKKVTFADFINGSSVKRTLLNYTGNERGSSILNLKKEEIILYDGSYTKYKIPYMRAFDSKLGNQEILCKKSPLESDKNVENINNKV